MFLLERWQNVNFVIYPIFVIYKVVIYPSAHLE